MSAWCKPAMPNPFLWPQMAARLMRRLWRRRLPPRRRLLLICSPGNPSGAVATEAELAALADVLRRHPGIAVISDDLYEHIVFAPAKFRTLAEVAPDLTDRILTVNGLSKAYAMTGWRIGYAGGPDWWTAGLRVLFSQTNGGPCSISQVAGVAALDGPQDFLAEKAQIYRRTPRSGLA